MMKRLWRGIVGLPGFLAWVVASDRLPAPPPAEPRDAPRPSRIRWLLTREPLPEAAPPVGSRTRESFIHWLFASERLPVTDGATEGAGGSWRWLLASEHLPPPPAGIPASEQSLVAWLFSRERLDPPPDAHKEQETDHAGR